MMMMPNRFWLRLSLLHLAVHLLREHAVSSSFAFVIETRTVRNRNRNRNLHHKQCLSTTIQTVPAALRYKHPKKGSNSMRVLRSKPEEYDDGIGDISNNRNNNDSNSNNPDSSNGKSNQTDGEALAAEFYKTLQQRQDQQQGEKDNNDASESESSVYSLESPSPSTSTDRPTIGSLFDADERDTLSSPPPPPLPPARKFTGRPADSYFGGRSRTTGSASNGNASGNGNANAVRERMMRREFDLVSGATGRTALGLQAGIALSMLVFFVYVGLTGGIVSGEEAIGADFGGGDDFIQFEEIIPVPRDSDASVWI